MTGVPSREGTLDLPHLEALGIDVGLDPAPERLLAGREVDAVDARRHGVGGEAVEQLVAVPLAAEAEQAAQRRQRDLARAAPPSRSASRSRDEARSR